MHDGSADAQFQVPASNEIFGYFVNSLASRSQLKVALSILFCQTQPGKWTEREAPISRIVISRERTFAINYFAIEQGTVSGPHNSPQTLGKLYRIECAESIPPRGNAAGASLSRQS